MGFDPVEHPRHYADPPGPFDPLKAQEGQPMPDDTAGEAEKLLAADTVILHFPIWWFGPPAILKGWLDRVLAHGHLHDVDMRFDRGRLAGKRLLICATTGASADEVSHAGREGDLDLLLWPVAQTFRYLGFTILRPLACHDVHGYHEGPDLDALDARLGERLARQADVIAGLDAHPVWPFNRDDDFDGTGRLKPGAPSHSPMIRHHS